MLDPVRYHSAIAFDDNVTALVCGGQTGDSMNTNVCSMYDARGDRWTPYAFALQTARYWHGSVRYKGTGKK
jgi:hypothetical protein